MYRVSIIPALEHDHGVIFSDPVKTMPEAVSALNAVASVLIHLGDSGAMPSYSNSLTLERLDDGGWVVIDEHGYIL